MSSRVVLSQELARAALRVIDTVDDLDHDERRAQRAIRQQLDELARRGPGGASEAPITLTADQWQVLTVNLHAARTLITRFAAGEATVDDPRDAAGAGILLETLEEWERLLEQLRPKTAAADRLRPS